MKLLNSFPEIDVFFNTNSFSQQELINFKNVLKLNNSKEFYRNAVSYINLKLLQFKLCEELNEPEKKSKPNTEKVSDSISNTEKVAVPLVICDLAKYLEVTDNFLLTILKQNGVEKEKDDRLEINEYALIKGFIFSRVKGLKRKNKQEKEIFKPIIKKSKKPSRGKTKPVYDKLATYGLGKIIYIRKS